MFSRVIPSSPVLEANNFNFNSLVDNTMDSFDNLDPKVNDANLNVMVNQLYANQMFWNNSGNNSVINVNNNIGAYVPPTNYQYTMNNAQQQHNLDAMNSIFSDNSLLKSSIAMEDVPSTTTTSTASDLDSLNLQFIHPQDVVSFPSVHACTPPMEQLSSRRASLLDNSAMPLKSLIDLELKQQQQQIMSQSLQQPTVLSDDFASSVDSTPIVSDLPQIHNSLDEVAHQRLVQSAALSFQNVVKSESAESYNDDDSQLFQTYYGQAVSEDDEEDGEIPEITEIKKYRVVRGVSSGGCATRPPKEAKNSSSSFAKVKLHLSSAGFEDMCLPAWNEMEKADRRRIIRVERRQNCADIVASFSIVGSAVDHPEPAPAEQGVDVVEVSCLETVVDENFDDSKPDVSSHNDEDTLLEDEIIEQEEMSASSGRYKTQYYVTSVEVIKIVELLIGTQPTDAANKRRERGRVRSNLVPFWSRKSVSSKKSHSNGSVESQDFRIELAQRIMGYETRKPRGFDKDVRILNWEKLIPALRRALQSYYVEIPEFEC